MIALGTVAPSPFADAPAVEGLLTEEREGTPAAIKTFGFHIRQHVMSAEAALKAKVPGVADLDVQLRKLVIAYDVMLDAREEVTIQPDGDILLTPYSAGVRISVKLSDFKADLKLNLYAVAVAASVGMVTTEASYSLLGLKRGIADVPPPNALNTEGGLETILKFILTVKTHMAEKPEDVRLIRLPTVSLGRRAVTIVDSGQSTVYAMRQIRRGKSLRQALDASVGLGFDPDSIRATYQSVLRHFTEDLPPTEEQSRKAAEWLNL